MSAVKFNGTAEAIPFARDLFSILVVWSDGEEELLKRGAYPDGETATFTSRTRADEIRNFMMFRMADEVQSISVVVAR